MTTASPRILDRTSVALCEVGDDHHVLDVPGRNAESVRELPQQRFAIVEVGANDQMGLV